ncbi:carcinoembryonic antigen-related cell adhesion molecule 6-like, partial [Pteropus vampyrus]|uniref:Carcinoembryonic antigen-related cell adhesion molecule 6-like n=1 Tax=Pteropus vampyrus TaxID=132908 RepID=A0A6P3RGN6_PTEVA
WQGLLLTVSLLTSWNPPTTAQPTLESLPSNAAEGKDVLLLVHNVPVNITGYAWYKGASVDRNHLIASYVIDSQENNPGPEYSARETIYPNGSLLFQNVTLKDTGYYTLQIIKKNLLNEEVTAQLRVYPALSTPNITSNNSDPVEDKDAVMLTCEPETQNTTYLWLVNHQNISDSAQLELSKDNRTLTLLRVTRNDTGPYECITWNPGSASCSDPFHLNVLYGPETPTISPSNPRYSSGANLSLSCHAASNPPAQYSWLINGRPQQLTQKLFIPNITVNDSGSYTCLVHNSVTGLNRTTVKTITVSAALSTPNITSNNSDPVEDKDAVVLTCEPETQNTTYLWLVNRQNIVDSARLELSKDNRTLTLLRVTRNDTGPYENDTGPYECVTWNPGSASRSDPFYLNVLYDSTAESAGLSDGAIVGIVIGVLVGVALIAALAYFLYSRKTGGYDGLSSCAASCKAKRHAWERGDFPLSLGLDLLEKARLSRPYRHH